MNEGRPLLEVDDLKKYYPMGHSLLGRARSYVRAVNGVSLEIQKGESFGLVGESGCGKSTLGRCILRLEEPTSGTIRLNGIDLENMNSSQLRDSRKEMQPVFQDPFSSLNPRRSVGKILEEPYTVHNLHSPPERTKLALELLERVGMRPEHYHRYPHEFSGGQRQRIAIARAIALKPSLIVADEPVSALDVSIQAQILNLIVELQHEFDLTILFISHDLAVVRHITDRIAVMYQGRIVELAPTSRLYSNPSHPYTRMLLSAIPSNDPRQRGRTAAGVEIFRSNLNGSGCPFYPRCEAGTEKCNTDIPGLTRIGDGHYVSCTELDT